MSKYKMSPPFFYFLAVVITIVAIWGLIWLFGFDTTVKLFTDPSSL